MGSDPDLVEGLARRLTERGETVAAAETTAGGLVSAALVAVPGSSAYFERGIVAYSKMAKISSLGMDEAELDSFGAVSVETAVAMATAAHELSGATYGIAETGIAGPIRGRSPKPIGTVHLAVASAERVTSRDVVLEGDRTGIREGIVGALLGMLAEELG